NVTPAADVRRRADCQSNAMPFDGGSGIAMREKSAQPTREMAALTLRPRAHAREPLICHNLFRRFKWARPAYYETKPTCRRGWQRRRLPEQESPRLAVSAASVPTDSGRGTVGSQWPSHSAQTCWPGRQRLQRRAAPEGQVLSPPTY